MTPSGFVEWFCVFLLTDLDILLSVLLRTACPVRGIRYDKYDMIASEVSRIYDSQNTQMLKQRGSMILILPSSIT
jgi:hypothetical protein